MVVLPPTITNRGRLAATPLAAASAPRSLATHRFTLHRAQPDPGTEKGGTHPHKPTYTHTHTHTHTHTERRGIRPDFQSRFGEEDGERKRSRVPASKLAGGRLLEKGEKKCVPGQTVPADLRRACPVHLGSSRVSCPQLAFTAPLALDTSPPRPHLRQTRRELFSRAMTPAAVTSKAPSPPSTCTRNTRPNSSNNEQLRPSREANSKQRQATAMTTPPQAACPSSRPSVQLSATPCALARPPRRGL